MKNEDIKKLTLALVNSETENEVVQVLNKFSLWENKNAWKEFDESSGNWSTIGNQQSAPDTALVEKIINSVDAVLMRECLKEGILPESKEAPHSIAEAQKKYFSIYNGKLSSIDANSRAKIAENIFLIATGSKNNPSYSIVDLGEGQSPESFPTTFLSLNKGNKNKVQFVQGKFGMGGTGVFRFGSPEHNLQLIISKQNKGIKSKVGSNQWGMTVIRRIPPTGQMKSSIFTYLAPEGKIFSFDSQSLPLLPGKHPKAYSEHLECGSFIKIYEYNLTGLKSNVRFDLFYRLSLLLPNIALPITLCERRDYNDKDGKTRDMKIVMSGLSVRLDEDKRDNLEDDFPSTGELNVKSQKMDYSIYAFRKDKRRTYSGNEGIVFTVNGQAHGFLPKSFFERKSVGMSYLADSILILIDCSKMEKRKQEDLFMNSRDRLSGGPLQDEIERQLEDIIKNHQGLRALREKRRREDIEDKLQDSKPLADVLENIIKKSPSLLSLFTQGVRIKNPFNFTGVTEKGEFKGREFPTYFKLVKEYTKEKPKSCPINNKRFRIQFETDAENNYFNRDKEPGELTLKINGNSIEDYSLNLWNGLATLNIGLPTSAEVGDILCLKAEVVDISRIEPFANEFCIKVEEQQEKNGGHGGNRKKPSSKERGEDRQKPTYLDIPNAWEIRRNEWDKHNFDEKSALKVVDAGEEIGYDFYINMDNVYLQMEIKENIKIDPKLLEARFKYGMVLLGISLIDFEEKRKKNEKQTQQKEDDISIFERISQFSRAISPTLLPMISSLGDLEIES